MRKIALHRLMASLGAGLLAYHFARILGAPVFDWLSGSRVDAFVAAWLTMWFALRVLRPDADND